MKYTEEDIEMDKKLTELRKEYGQLERGVSDKWQEMVKVFRYFKKQKHEPKDGINRYRYLHRRAGFRG